MSRVSDGINFDLPFAGDPTQAPVVTPTPTAEPVADPATIDPGRNISITILNGTATSGLQNVVGDSLAGANWPVGARTQASAHDVDETLVYYSDPANEDVARGVVVALGVGKIRLSDAFLGAPITVVVGADYVAPAPAG